MVDKQNKYGLKFSLQRQTKKPQSLKKLIEEVTDICVANKWKFTIFEEDFPNNTFTTEPNKHKAYGICFTPPKCETIDLTFLSNGKLCAFYNLELNKKLEKLEDDIYLYYLSVKTQYCGPEIHKTLISIFDYLNRNYFEDFEFTDEGQFWETRDEKLLEEIFNRYSNLISSLGSVLEHIPILEGESIENYILRMAEIVKKTTMNKEDNNENELPKLSIEEENEFKKLKLDIEYGMDFSKNTNSNIPPEIEGQFLDYVSNFENASKNAKQITVFKKLGKPEYKPESILTNDEITIELERIELLMQNQGINLDVLADYIDEERLIYKFITEELFEHEITDMNMPGLRTCFIYEEFHPNHEYDLKHATEDFLRMFFNTKSGFYDDYHSKDASNHDELNNFRSLFKKFKMKFFDFKNIAFDEQKAKVEFNIDFWAKIAGTETKINYSGNGSMTFENEYDYWCVRTVDLPITN